MSIVFGKRKGMRRNNVEKFAWIFLSLLTISILLPLIYIIIISISSEDSIMKYGYQLIPKEFSLKAYELLLVHYGDS